MPCPRSPAKTSAVRTGLRSISTGQMPMVYASACLARQSPPSYNALGGAQGVQSVLEHVRDNLTIVMRLAGTKSVKEITRDYIAPAVVA